MTIPILMRRMAAALERLSMTEPGSEIYRAVLDDLLADVAAVWLATDGELTILVPPEVMERAGGVAVGAA